jgi:hypothetical protein
VRDGLVLADRHAPLLALVGPAADDLDAALGDARARRGQREPPVLSVMRAILRPFPSSPTRFSRGTCTLSKLMMPLARAFRPMKRQRCSTFTPGQSVSTMKQLIFFVFGSRAMTTRSSAMVPFVHQSFSPLIT